MRFFYSILFFVLLPLAFWRLWQRGKKAPAYRERWAERLGISSTKGRDQRPLLWFHTVSVGEFIAAKSLIQHYVDQGSHQLLITCMTPTGSEQIQKNFGKNVLHCYLPYDLQPCINAFLTRYQPQVFVCIETELWPNLIHACHKRHIPSIVANARLSQKSARGYGLVKRMSRSMLSKITLAAIQNTADAGRFVKLGLKPERAKIIGNIKYDLNIPEQIQKAAQALKKELCPEAEPVFIAASTHSGEDEPVLDAFSALKKQYPSLRLILVPRHPERFNDVYKLCQASGFNCLRRSDNKELKNCDILLGDTMGELLLMLGASDYAFIGGSLVENGGHNYIEAAAWSLPIFAGPSTFNFQQVADELIESGGLQLVKNSVELSEKAEPLLLDKSEAKKRGSAAKAVAEKNRGAQARLISLIDERL
ncbi:lipid IV(A) 3-deoxy-D-manno-octulosonic acid transferase [Agaribacterium sp. ZY112]|uniref:lipid IV(A) 3-deoxy-D-manno-octulosonic acid transferase n=1 Tax=Agaribacterium sp. ZY112 TaxID=3233574 RepID=UPI003524241B